MPGRTQEGPNLSPPADLETLHWEELELKAEPYPACWGLDILKPSLQPSLAQGVGGNPFPHIRRLLSKPSRNLCGHHDKDNEV